jgi:hypothetical protein
VPFYLDVFFSGVLPAKNKKSRNLSITAFIAIFYSAQDKIRTCTPVKAPAPQAGVSTNSTTWACFWAAKVKLKSLTLHENSKKNLLVLHGLKN